MVGCISLFLICTGPPPGGGFASIRIKLNLLWGTFRSVEDYCSVKPDSQNLKFPVSLNRWSQCWTAGHSHIQRKETIVSLESSSLRVFMVSCNEKNKRGNPQEDWALGSGSLRSEEGKCLRSLAGNQMGLSSFFGKTHPKPLPAVRRGSEPLQVPVRGVSPSDLNGQVLKGS